MSAWGDYDRDDPFPLFAEVRDRGAVHAVTLADGHEAWLDRPLRRGPSRAQRSTVLEGHAAAIGDEQRGRGRRPAGTGVRPAHAHRRPARPHPPATPRLRRVLEPTGRGAAPTRADDRRRSARRASPLEVRTRQVDLVASFAFPLPFTVICELLGVPDGDRARLGRALIALLTPGSTPEEYALAKAGSDEVVGDARRARRGQAAVARRRPRHRADRAARRRRATRTNGAAVDGLPADRRGARHDDAPDRQRRGRPAAPSRSSSPPCERIRPRLPAAIEELLRFDAPVPHSTFRYATEAVELGRRDDPGRCVR